MVGTGSVGLRDYVIYFEALSRPHGVDPLFLQIKEEPASAYAPYLPEGSGHTHEGHRVMDGQRAMQLTSDPFLGYTTIEGRDYLVRQLNDHKAVARPRTSQPGLTARLRRHLRRTAGPRPRPRRRSGNHRGLSRHLQPLRPRDPQLRPRLLRQDRARLGSPPEVQRPARRKEGAGQRSAEGPAEKREAGPAEKVATSHLPAFPGNPPVWIEGLYLPKTRLSRTFHGLLSAVWQPSPIPRPSEDIRCGLSFWR